jgi:hypothetical protein
MLLTAATCLQQTSIMAAGKQLSNSRKTTPIVTTVLKKTKRHYTLFELLLQTIFF